MYLGICPSFYLADEEAECLSLDSIEPPICLTEESLRKEGQEKESIASILASALTFPFVPSRNRGERDTERERRCFAPKSVNKNDQTLACMAYTIYRKNSVQIYPSLVAHIPFHVAGNIAYPLIYICSSLDC